MKSIFIEGPISADFIASSIAKHQSKKNIGAHEIFLGQVRADEVDGQVVRAIEFTCYREMAESKAHEIREEAFARYDLTCMHIYHSLGEIKSGEICYFVFASSVHRNEARTAVAFLVDKLKVELPIFGKELFEDQGHQWKSNKSLI